MKILYRIVLRQTTIFSFFFNQAQGTVKKSSRGNFRRLANSTTSACGVPGNLGRNKSLKTRQTERDATLTTVLVVTSFVICYSIHYFFIFSYSYTLMTGKWVEMSPLLFTTLETCWLLLMNLNSALNPVIYLFRNTTFKHELINLKNNLMKYTGKDTVPHFVMREKGTSSYSC